MKVIHLSTYDLAGGSGRSAYRIHTNLCAQGIDSRMFVSRKDSELSTINTLTRHSIEQRANTWISKIYSVFGLQYQCIPFTGIFYNNKYIRQADIYHLYNIHGDYLSISMLNYLASRAPIVLRLSDLWPLTGHCAYPGTCVKWQKGCGNCPDLGIYPSIGCDKTAYLWKQKIDFLIRNKVSIVAPSNWTYEAVRSIKVLQTNRLFKIQNGINLSVFKPLGQAYARKALAIQQKKVALLFVAEKSYPNVRKGSDKLEKALKIIGPLENLMLLAVGYHSNRWHGKVPVQVISFNSTNDAVLLNMYYNAADIVCVPSSEDNLPNTVVEACAAGKPIIAMNNGGIRDGVINDYNGILCEINDAETLAIAIMKLVDNHLKREVMGNNSRTLAVQVFDATKEAEKYSSLYENLLKDYSMRNKF